MLISAVIAPAVLISAAGLLILGTVNRYGRIIDKIYLLNRALLETDEAAFREELREERALFALRARRAWIALSLLHAAVLCFVCESLLLGLAHATQWVTLTPLQNGVVVAGILFFGGASISLLSEASVAYETTRRAMEITDAKIEEKNRPPQF